MLKSARRNTVLALAVVTGLGIASLASAADMAGSGVSFVNSGKSTVYVYTRHGAGDSCDNMHGDKTLKIKAGETAKVDSGDNKVCYCLMAPTRTDGCSTGWQQVAPGGSLTLQ